MGKEYPALELSRKQAQEEERKRAEEERKEVLQTQREHLLTKKKEIDAERMSIIKKLNQISIELGERNAWQMPEPTSSKGEPAPKRTYAGKEKNKEHTEETALAYFRKCAAKRPEDGVIRVKLEAGPITDAKKALCGMTKEKTPIYHIVPE
eukprot:GHVN01100373.1.p1 GENE.GHVN01100373.1~~GHVN01100373.1.p1  ORF type:complete len:151 (+),score=21.28 GHVN01100373.1:251-703(+)